MTAEPVDAAVLAVTVPEMRSSEPGPTSDVVRTLRRLTARVGWLEDRLRESGTVPSADLDSADEAMRDLAAAVSAGCDAEERLLGERDRAAYDAALDWFSRLERERDEATNEMLEISAALGSTSRTDPVHVRQLAKFADAERRLAGAEEAVDAYGSTAQSAYNRLATDKELREELAATIEAGGDASSALVVRLRTRLATELGRGALMPAWFSGELGPGPGQARDAVGVRQSAEFSAPSWFEVAIAALAYRAVYEVDDATSLLGAEPAAGMPRHRAAAYRRLRSWLARLAD